MNFEEWKPYYEGILNEFLFDPRRDEEACEFLSKKLGAIPGLSALDSFRSRNTAVIGNSPDMEAQLDKIEGRVTIVAGSAIVKYYDLVGIPDILVTDLDYDFGLSEKCASEGTVVFIHAHGDNMDLLRKFSVPEKGVLFGTCQCEPSKFTLNFGGFTDGDRGVFLADYLGSPRIMLLGFDFSNVSVLTTGSADLKKRKLKVAEELISVLKKKRIPVYGTDNISIL